MSVLALSGKKKKRWFSLRGFWTNNHSFLWFHGEQWKKGVVKRIHCSIVNKIRTSRCGSAGSEHLQHVILVLISPVQPAVFLSLLPDLQFRVKPVHFPEEGDILSVLFYDPLQPSVTLCTNLFTHLQILAAYFRLWALWRGREKMAFECIQYMQFWEAVRLLDTRTVLGLTVYLIHKAYFCA